MTPLQNQYLSLLVKSRHNDLVFQKEMGNRIDDSEIALIEELFQSGVLDEEAVYPIDKG